MGYRTLAVGPDATAEIEVKRSRFLAVLRRVGSEEDARALTGELRRTHHDARHHCSAFVIGPRQQLQRSNDDGEPAGTAGMPMLQVLLGAGISDVAAVVVRWFGGTLLGAGGLVRAYGDAVTAALAAAGFVEREQLALADLELPHADAGRVESELRANGVTVLGTDYAAVATLHLAVADLNRLRELVAVATSGTAELVETGSRWIDLPT
ncbi:IMPACT family protein [Nakamurella lactea]|uniref:IMPACT family protein n=1 Tax=Nakamurella lactea TaxID=459515 RepID=UPI00040ADB5A|nr:YigZ family protein [Nakamurella lactea]